MEPRLVIAYGLMVMLFVSAVVFASSVIRRRRKHRHMMSGRRIHPS